MNTKTLKTLTVAMALAGGIGASAPAMATPLGLQSLPAGAGNFKDVWGFSCPPGTGAQARVNDLANPNTATDIQVVLSHDGFPTNIVTDFTDNGLPTPFTAVIPESGPYVLFVHRVGGATAEIYNGDVRCVGGGVIVNPLIFRAFNNLL